MHLIKFKHCAYADLRTHLLRDLSKESFAVLFGKMEVIGGCKIINVRDTYFLKEADYKSQSVAYLHLEKTLIYKKLVELTTRLDVDTIVDVHTHPFCESNVNFSGVDDQDEITFFRFLNDKFDDLNYASIVLSRLDYTARIWELDDSDIISKAASIKTQTTLEVASQPERNESCEDKPLSDSGFLNRSVLALGIDAMRSITTNQVLTVIGVGGTGSIVAEHLIHMGFNEINLIDPDVLEISNLNRIVGATFNDAKENKLKVDALQSHLCNINPDATINVFPNSIYEDKIEQFVALSDWLIVCTDNHSSRFKAQQLAFKYFVPLISVGVNITVTDGSIEDMSGEVITIRIGDRLCLNCLGRINPTKVAQEVNPELSIREELINRGYVTGKEVIEPAVKTLNCMVSTLAVEVLINQYIGRQRHEPILVYEANKQFSIYSDKESIYKRNLDCYTCSI